jgi:hypothetical protein
MPYVLTDLVSCQPEASLLRGARQRGGAGRAERARGRSGGLLSPRADSAHPRDPDPDPDARRRIVHRRKAHIGAKVHARELLKQLRSPAFLDRRSAMDDDVLAQAGRMDPGSLEGECNAGIPSDVLELCWRRSRWAVSSPSRSTATHTHVTCRLPSGLLVTRWPSAPARISSLALSGRVTAAESTPPPLCRSEAVQTAVPASTRQARAGHQEPAHGLADHAGAAGPRPARHVLAVLRAVRPR